MSTAPRQEVAAPNLQEQLDCVVPFLSGYLKFVPGFWAKAWLKYCIANLFRHPFHLHAITLRQVFLPKQDLLSGKTAAFRIPVFAFATEKDKRSEFFPIYTADYPVHALSLELMARWPDYNFVKLTALHDVLEKDRIQFTGRHMLGVIIAAGSFLLKEVPKKVVQDQLGISYAAYTQNVFRVGLVAAAYLLLGLLPAWWLVLRARRKHKFVGYVLQYTALLALKVKND